MTEKRKRLRMRSVVMPIGSVIELEEIDAFNNWVVTEITEDPDAIWRLVASEGTPEYAPETMLVTLVQP